MTPFRGRGPEERTLSSVTGVLDHVRALALARALDPRNVAKGTWRDLHPLVLVAKVAEEVGELARAVALGTPEEVEHEAGDLVWSAAMLVDVVLRRRRESEEA